MISCYCLDLASLAQRFLHTSKIGPNRRKNGEANGFVLSRPPHEYSDYLIFLIHATMDEGRLIFQKRPWIASVEILEIVRLFGYRDNVLSWLWMRWPRQVMGSVPFLAWAHLLPTIAHPPESDAANPLQIRWFSSLSKIRSFCQPHNWNLSLGVFGEWLWILMDECPSLTTNWAIMRDVKFLMQKHSGCVASDALLRASYSNGAWDLVGLFSLSSVFTNTSSDLGHIRFWERKGALCVCVCDTSFWQKNADRGNVGSKDKKSKHVWRRWKIWPRRLEMFFVCFAWVLWRLKKWSSKPYL